MTSQFNQNQDFFNTITPISLSSSPNYNGIATSHIVGGNGIFTYAKTQLAEKCIKETDYTINPDLPKVEQYIKFNEHLPKIPLEAFYSMLAFYKRVYEQDGTEAQMNFYWNKDVLNEIEVDGMMYNLDAISGLKDWGKGLISYVPVQENSGALTTTDDPIYQALREQMMPFVETHSHNVMAAFKSGTDEKNSFADELQLVIGNITSSDFDFYNWVTIRGKQIDNLEEDIIKQIVELPDTFENKSLDKLPSIPDEWMQNHSKMVYKSKVLSGDEEYYNKYIKDQENLFDEEEDKYENETSHILDSFTNSEREDHLTVDAAPVDNKVEEVATTIETNENDKQENNSKMGLFKRIKKFFKKG